MKESQHPLISRLALSVPDVATEGPGSRMAQQQGGMVVPWCLRVESSVPSSLGPETH